jgi:hypothetical protein
MSSIRRHLPAALALAACAVAGAAGATGLGAQPAAPAAPAPIRPGADPRVERLVAAVSQERLEALVRTLASFGTRSTLSDTLSATRGIGAARRWIFDELRRSSPRLQVAYDRHPVARQGRIVRDVDVVNVIAVLPGKSPRRVYVTGHYDTVNPRGASRTAFPTGATSAGAGAAGAAEAARGGDAQLRPEMDHDVDAPGANDDGSGTALTMELARVFAESGLEFDATLVFALWAGEEQGLVGSMAHAQALAAANGVVEANLNNDIVGNSLGGNGFRDGESVKVYSLGPEDSPHRSLARYIRDVAGVYVPSHAIRLMAREDRFQRGSDHSSMAAFGFPAAVFREANEHFGRQHSSDDTVEGVDFAYLAQNARVNAAVAASLALAPPAPRTATARGVPTIGRGASGYDAALQWTASPGAVAYRIVWRDAWSNDWQRSLVVGNVTTHTLPNLNIDDLVFGVAAIGPGGHESLVSAWVSPDRRMTPVTLRQTP